MCLFRNLGLWHAKQNLLLQLSTDVGLLSYVKMIKFYETKMVCMSQTMV